jgi:imidazolonepropionase-like amidohydrolase
MDALVRLAGLSPAEAITATTRDAAAALRLNTGLIVAGRLADLILIKGNPLENILYAQNVAQVIKGGVVQFPTPRPTTHY